MIRSDASSSSDALFEQAIDNTGIKANGDIDSSCHHEESNAEIENMTNDINEFSDIPVKDSETFAAAENSSLIQLSYPTMDTAAGNSFSNQNTSLNRTERIQASTEEPVLLSSTSEIQLTKEHTENDGSSKLSKFSKMKGFGRIRRYSSCSAMSLSREQLATKLQRGNSLRLPPIGQHNTGPHYLPSSIEINAAYFNSLRDREKRFSIDEDRLNSPKRGHSRGFPGVDNHG